jgi:putative hemolysin
MSVEGTLEPERSRQRFSVSLASNLDEVREAQVLRYQVFAEEMGATLETPLPLHDVDEFDAYCHHVVVRDQDTGKVVGCTRLLTSEEAKISGGFYSQSEFDLSQVLALPAKFMEIGRTCVHADYRNGLIISLLWSQVAKFMAENAVDYLMGCASIPLRDDRRNALFSELVERYSSHADLRVYPKVSLRQDHDSTEPPLPIPPLLRAYLRLGAQICGEPCWDANFKVADVFILVGFENLQKRYIRHFFDRLHTNLPKFHEIVA